MNEWRWLGALLFMVLLGSAIALSYAAWPALFPDKSWPALLPSESCIKMPLAFECGAWRRVIF